AKRMGDLDLIVKNHLGRTSSIHMEDVLEIPSLRGNLISVHNLVDDALEVVFTCLGAIVVEEGSTVILNPDDTVKTVASHTNKHFIVEATIEEEGFPMGEE